jgi:membrane-associated phospholipid phosphatase
MQFSQAQSVDSTFQEEVILVDTSTVIVDDVAGVPLNKESLAIDTKKDTITTQVIEEHPLQLLGFVPPASMMLYALTIKGNSGLYSSQNIHTFPDFHSTIDNYLQYVPLVSAYVTGFIPGTKPRHSNGRRLWMFIQAQVLTTVAVQALKHYTHEERPNGSDYLSFPSGHTAQAFMGAALFDAEYPNQLKGLKIGLYALAGLTGIMRMMNDDHWANDVLFGAGVGILSVRLLYWSEQQWKKKKTIPR